VERGDLRGDWSQVLCAGWLSRWCWKLLYSIVYPSMRIFSRLRGLLTRLRLEIGAPAFYALPH